MTDTPRELPSNWQELDAMRSYDEYVRLTGERVRAGEPLPQSMRRREPAADGGGG